MGGNKEKKRKGEKQTAGLSNWIPETYPGTLQTL